MWQEVRKRGCMARLTGLDQHCSNNKLKIKIVIGEPLDWDCTLEHYTFSRLGMWSNKIIIVSPSGLHINDIIIHDSQVEMADNKGQSVQSESQLDLGMPMPGHKSGSIPSKKRCLLGCSPSLCLVGVIFPWTQTVSSIRGHKFHLFWGLAPFLSETRAIDSPLQMLSSRSFSKREMLSSCNLEGSSFPWAFPSIGSLHNIGAI